MAKYSTESTVTPPSDGDSVSYKDHRVGEITYHAGQPVLVWHQIPLRVKSDSQYTAYSMSEGLMHKLDKMGVEGVYIEEDEVKFVHISQIKSGEYLPPDADLFNEPREEPQRVIYVN